ncbi:hypothetical protein F4212_05370 [Candidatus Poribacteria bacterium]|nr:hypothetical protein [Candidatus Poribacteria bacterium]
MDRFRNFIVKFWKSQTRWVMVITFAGMGLSLLFHAVLIPRYLGLSETADALIASLKVVLLFDIVIREGAKFSLVPLFINEARHKNREDFNLLTNGILNFSLCVGFLCMLLIEVFADWIAYVLLLLLPNSSIITRSEMIMFLRLTAPLVVFGSASTVLGAILNSQKHFKTVALRNALPPGIASLIFLLLLGNEHIAQFVAIAYTCGFLAYFVWLFIGVKRIGHRYMLTGLSSDVFRTLKNTISLPTLGFTIRQMTARLLVEVFLVGKLGKGAITLYNSAFRIFSAIQTLIGISIATTGLPSMTEEITEEDKGKFRQTLMGNIRTVIFIAVPISLFLIFGSSIIAKLLYGDDKFSEQSIQQISQLLFCLSFATVFFCLIPVLNAGLYAQRAFGYVFRNMVTMAVLNFIIALGLVNVWGLTGIAIAVSLTAVIAVVNLSYLLQKTGVSLFS